MTATTLAHVVAMFGDRLIPTFDTTEIENCSARERVAASPRLSGVDVYTQVWDQVQVRVRPRPGV